MPEGDFHYYVKDELYTLLSASAICRNCQSERIIGAVRPDISLYIHRKPVAIEIQHSAISVEEIQVRTDEYTQQGIHVLWLVLEGFGDPDIKTDKTKYTPTVWEKYLHALYFGRVYYYHGGLEVMPVHFDPYFIHVPVREWYDSDGQDHVVGGYDRKSRRYRVLSVGKPTNIVRDFRASYRDEWTAASMHIPACRIWIDRGRKWW